MYTPLTLFFKKSLAKALLLLLCSLLTVDAFAVDYYVALTGSNSNNGRSVAAPFATLQKAADGAQAGDVVHVRAGVYREMVDLKADGVTYQPYNGEAVTINGADLMLAWTRTAGTTYQTTMDWDVEAKWGTNQVFADGKMIELARWPDQTSNDIVMPTNAKADGVTASGNNFIITDAAFNEPAGRWVGAEVWVNLARLDLDGQGWTGGKVVATSGNTITVDFKGAPRLGYQAWSVGEGTEYFLFNPTPAGVNATGGVDALLGAGEWWKNGNTLYVKTRNGAAPSATGTGANVIEAKRRHFAFWASTTRAGYTIKDFRLFGCAITTDKDATYNRGIVEAAHDLTLSGLNVLSPSHQTDMSGNWQDQHYTWSGIVLSGRNNTIRNCAIRYSATSALSVQGFGAKVLNNQIQDANYMVSNSGAMNTGFICQDADIGYNKIWNTTMIAINIRYSQNSNPAVRDKYRIHHNEIYDFLRRSWDSGAIDMFGQDLQWIRIDHNRIYNTLDDAKYGGRRHGIYFDYGQLVAGGGEGKIRATVDHNVVYEVDNAMLINPGVEVSVFNNTFLTHAPVPGHTARGGFAITFDGNNKGRDVKVYNNIFSDPIVINPRNAANVMDARNNITNAAGAVLATLFVNAAGGDYRLKPTATAAIDKGISVAPYDDSNVQGLPDLGAFELNSPVSGPLSSLAEQSASAGLTLHPNPAREWVSLDLSTFAAEKAVWVRLVDMSGREVLAQRVLLSASAAGTVRLPIGQLRAGVYSVRAQGSNVSKTAKLVILH